VAFVLTAVGSIIETLMEIDEMSTEKLPDGRITVTLKPLLEGIRSDRSLGLREALGVKTGVFL